MLKKAAPDTSKTRRRAMLISFNENDAERAANEPSTISLALSSEEPYLRGGFFMDPYYEILDHSAKSIVMDRLKDGAALLFNHNRDAHLGLVDNPKIGSDNVLRVDARFASNALAQEKKADVADGTLRWTSIAYKVLEQVLEKQSKDGPDTYRVTKWEILEGSLVTVPADASVGVGRSADGLMEVPPEVIEKMKADAKAEADAAVEQELTIARAAAAEAIIGKTSAESHVTQLQGRLQEACERNITSENYQAGVLERAVEQAKAAEQAAKGIREDCQRRISTTGTSRLHIADLERLYAEMCGRAKATEESAIAPLQNIADEAAKAESAARAVREDCQRRLSMVETTRQRIAELETLYAEMCKRAGETEESSIAPLEHLSDEAKKAEEAARAVREDCERRLRLLKPIA